MIKIRAKQMEAIDLSRQEHILEIIVAQLQFQYPDSPSASELRSELKPLVEQVSGWGIRSGSFLALHVLACKVIGVDYYTLPGFEATFADPDISDGLKEEWLGGLMLTLREEKSRTCIE